MSLKDLKYLLTQKFTRRFKTQYGQVLLVRSWAYRNPKDSKTFLGPIHILANHSSVWTGPAESKLTLRLNFFRDPYKIRITYQGKVEDTPEIRQLFDYVITEIRKDINKK